MSPPRVSEENTTGVQRKRKAKIPASGLLFWLGTKLAKQIMSYLTRG
jgi:hypothetical protein